MVAQMVEQVAADPRVCGLNSTKDRMELDFFEIVLNLLVVYCVKKEIL